MIKFLPLITSSLFLVACSPTSPRPRPKPNLIPILSGEFIHPADGQTISLTIGENLSGNPQAIVPPSGIFHFQQATSSFYTFQGEKIAESSVTWKEQSIEIQHEPTSGKILITEDSSDALPVKRYILLSPLPGLPRRLNVHYLSPHVRFWNTTDPDLHIPPELILLPNHKVWVEGGSIIKLSDIYKSTTPISTGG